MIAQELKKGTKRNVSRAYEQDFNQRFWKTWSFAWLYVIADIRRNQRVFVVGLTAVMLVVTFLTVLQNAIQQSPIIFLRLSEQSAGELDLVLTPTVPYGSNESTFPLVNQVEVDTALMGSEKTMGAAPRWLLLGNISNPISPTLRSRVRVVILDTLREEQINLGRGWPYRRLNQQEMLVSDSLLRELDVLPRMGDRVEMSIDFLGVLNQFSSGNTTGISVLNGLLQGAGINVDELIGQQRDTLTALLGPLANTSEPLPETIAIDGDTVSLFSTILGIPLPFDPDTLPDEVAVPPVLQQAIDLVNSPLFTLQGDELLEFLIFNFTTQAAATANATGATGAALTADDLFTLRGDFIVHDELKGSLGRWPNVLGNIVAIDSKYVTRFFEGNIRRVICQLNSVFGLFTGLVALTGGSTTTTTNVVPVTVNGTISNETIVETVVTENPPLNLNGIADQVAFLNINELALLSIVMFKDRIKNYLKTGDDLDIAMARLSDDAMEPLGADSRYLPALPLLFAIRGTNLIRLFLDQLFLAVMSVLVFLGCLLIYQLIIADVEEKTYEYGMLRALGMRKFTLMQLVSTQSALFAITGICAGLFLAFLLSIYPTYFLSSFGYVEPDYNLRGIAIAVGLSLGIFMPLLSNILPIRRALGRTLRDSLDVYHQSFNDVSVTFIKLSQMGLSPWQTSLAITMVCTGFIVYYMFPWAITFGDFRLLLTLLLIILLGMVFGLTFVAVMVQPMLEPYVLWMMLWGKTKRLEKLIRQNMVGHRGRNSKTALMFTTSLGFLIFAGTMFSIQAETIPEQLKIFFGSDIVINAPTLDVALNSELMREYLEDNMKLPYGQGRLVENYAFRTFPLQDLTDYIDGNRFANLAGLRNYNVDAVGIERSYLKATYSEYFIPTEYDKSFDYAKVNGRRDIFDSIYKDAGKVTEQFAQSTTPIKVGSGEESIGISDLITEQLDIAGLDLQFDQFGSIVKPLVPGEAYKNVYDVIASEALRLPAGISRATPTRLVVRYEVRAGQSANRRRFFRAFACTNRALVRKTPGFFTTSYRFGAWGSPLLMSMDTWWAILKRTIEDVDQTKLNAKFLENFPKSPPIGGLWVKLAPGVSRNDRETVLNRLKGFVTDDLTEVTDVVQLVASTQTAALMIMLFFTIVGAVTITLSFFVLWTTFYANVKENAWEFGVLRSIGLTIGQLQIANVFEGLTVIISSIILGCFIGFLVAITLTLQFQVFLESPFVFRVPWMLFGVMISLSIFCAILGSYIPSRALAKSEIAQVIRKE